MTRGNLLIVIVLVLALAGMFFWTLSLHHRLADQGGVAGDLRPDRGSENAERLDAVERRMTALSGAQDASRVELSELDRRVRAVETASADQAIRIASLGSGEPVAAGGDPAPASGLKAAIEGVLEERQQEERRQRLERMAQGMARWLLADVEATREQTEEFVKVVTGYLDEREKVRERYSAPGSDSQARDAELKTLEEERNAKLLTIFGSAQYTKIEQRLNRGGRFRDGGGRGAPFRRGR